MKRTGMTLIELIVYMALSILAGFLILALYQLATQAQNSTISSYVVGGDTETAIRRLRRELQETALVSLRTYPSQGNTSERPGCSFTSARTSDGDAALNVSVYGAPQWRKNVFYTVNPSNAQTGQLVRWEQELTAAEMDFVPRPATILASTMGTKQQSIPLKQVLLGNTKVENLTGSPNYTTDGFGGFRVQFVRRTGGEAGVESMSSINPGDNAKVTDTADNTSLVEVEMKILTSANSGKPSFYAVKFRVHPRY